ncbi:hypothetical protein OIV83_001478 [Microbotryomycetes sp. JL201]|nr:hypothetical protein OIV83_001478 [Microbotryomycetes sp. JL201]
MGWRRTGYGAAGGFMANSQDSPGAGKARGPQSLRPVTIYQIQNAEQVHPEADFTIDGAEVKDITFVACVRNKAASTTNIAYLVEDGTGQIDARQWTNAAEDSETQFGNIENNTYVRILGTVKSFGGKRSINCNCIRPVTDMNEINFHMVEVAYVAMYYRNGGRMGAKIDMNGVAGAVGYAGNDPYTANDSGEAEAATDYSTFPAEQRTVLIFLKSNKDRFEHTGTHINQVKREIFPDKSIAELKGLMEDLSSAGAVFELGDDTYGLTHLLDFRLLGIAMTEVASVGPQSALAMSDYSLHYHAGLPGRAEFIRLVFEATGVQFTDGPQVDGQQNITQYVNGTFENKSKNPLPFAVPVLKHGNLVISHVSNIILYLATRLPPIDLDGAGVAEGEPEQLSIRTFHWMGQLLTILDLNNEVHETHHPIDVAKYYEEQKDEAKKRAEAFRLRRIPKFLGNFEKNIALHDTGFLGPKVSPADLALFHMVEGLFYAFPKCMEKIQGDYPRVIKLRDTIKKSKRIQAYIESGRRIPFNESPRDRGGPDPPVLMSEQVSVYSNRSGGIGSQLNTAHSTNNGTLVDLAALYGSHEAHLSALGGRTGSTLSIALDHVRTTIQKRIQMVDYLKRAHSGRVFWFNTVHLDETDLAKLFEPSRVRSRTTRYFVLGMSLSALLDIPSSPDYFRALSALMQEFDSVPDDRFDRRNQRGLFRVASRARKSTTGGSDFAASGPDGDASYLIAPNIPFDLDYVQAFITLCEVLSETYRKISTHLGPARPPSFPQPPSASSTSGFSKLLSQSDKPGVNGVSPAVAETVLKIDARLKKIITLVSKELDGCARAAVKRELAMLDTYSEWADDV